MSNTHTAYESMSRPRVCDDYKITRGQLLVYHRTDQDVKMEIGFGDSRALKDV